MKFLTKNMDIAGVCCAVPGEALNVFDIDSTFTEKEKKKFSKMTGVQELYRTNENQTTLDLCIESGKELLNKLNWNPKEVKGLIFVTQTPDYVLPISSGIAQSELGVGEDCFCLDINLGCSGYVYGLQVASNLLQKDNCEKVLLLVGDTISKIISPEDKSVSLLFGDAGSATAIQYDEDASDTTFIFGTDGSGANNLIVPFGGFRNRVNPTEELKKVTDASGNERFANQLYMNGTEVFNFTLKEVPNLIENVLQASQVELNEVDYFILHQANKFMLEQIARKVGIEREKMPISIDRYGNTSSATIPLALVSDPVNTGGIIREKRLLLSGFGVGYSWGAVVVNCKNMLVLDLVHI